MAIHFTSLTSLTSLTLLIGFGESRFEGPVLLSGKGRFVKASPRGYGWFGTRAGVEVGGGGRRSALKSGWRRRIMGWRRRPCAEARLRSFVRYPVVTLSDVGWFEIGDTWRGKEPRAGPLTRRQLSRRFVAGLLGALGIWFLLMGTNWSRVTTLHLVAASTSLLAVALASWLFRSNWSRRTPKSMNVMRGPSSAGILVSILSQVALISICGTDVPLAIAVFALSMAIVLTFHPRLPGVPT